MTSSLTDIIFKTIRVNLSANQMRAPIGCYGDPTINRQVIDNQWEDAFRSNQKSVCIQFFVTHCKQNTITCPLIPTADDYR